ncbi:hypothetical protein M514_18137 [Trichuris suis]|uniref:Uncharacterized protein n=1 Tax=Trichuris suis TaxID=68888 RepID=A0A085NJV6_9BILA|nr:hypothetical protein M514_18137 [Trichuris suis]
MPANCIFTQALESITTCVAMLASDPDPLRARRDDASHRLASTLSSPWRQGRDPIEATSSGRGHLDEVKRLRTISEAAEGINNTISESTTFAVGTRNFRVEKSHLEDWKRHFITTN